MFYVYTYTDPHTNDVIYVGKGHDDRDQYHIRNRNTHYNKGFGEHLQKIVDSGELPQILQVRLFNVEQDAYDLERSLIEQYGRLDLGTGTLHNRTPGGEGYGRTGVKWTTKFREDRLSHNQTNPRGARYDKYTVHGELVESNLTTADLIKRGYTKSDVTAIRAACRGKRFTVKGHRWTKTNEPLPLANSKGKFIEKLDYSGTVLGVYCSIQDAGRQCSINASDINQCILGSAVTAGGYMWRIKGSEVLKSTKRSARPIIQRSKTGDFIKQFGTMVEAAKCANTSVEEIGRAASGKRRTAGGFIWEYVD